VAEQIALALEGRGDQVFFDRDSLTAGAEFYQRIQNAIDQSDFLIFLISADSVRRGSYALTELKSARLKWPHPQNRVLPVLVRPVDLAAVPAYLQGAARQWDACPRRRLPPSDDRFHGRQRRLVARRALERASPCSWSTVEA
jgi:hypothetical protein